MDMASRSTRTKTTSTATATATAATRTTTTTTTTSHRGTRWYNVRCRLLDDVDFDDERRRVVVRRHYPRRKNRMVAIEIYQQQQQQQQQPNRRRRRGTSGRDEDQEQISTSTLPSPSISISTAPSSREEREKKNGDQQQKSLFPQLQHQQPRYQYKRYQQQLNDHDMVYLTIYKKRKVTSFTPPPRPPPPPHNKTNNNISKKKKKKNENTKKGFGRMRGFVNTARSRTTTRTTTQTTPLTTRRGSFVAGGVVEGTKNLVGRFLLLKTPTTMPNNGNKNNKNGDDDEEEEEEDAENKQRRKQRQESIQDQEEVVDNDDDDDDGRSSSSRSRSRSSSGNSGGDDDVSFSSPNSHSSSSPSSSSSCSSSSSSFSSSSFDDDDDENDDVDGSSIILGGVRGVSSGLKNDKSKTVKNTSSSSSAAAAVGGAVVLNSTERMREIVRGVLDTTMNSNSSHRHNNTRYTRKSSNLIRRNQNRNRKRGEMSLNDQNTTTFKNNDEDDPEDYGSEDENGWIEAYRIRLEEVEVLEKRKKDTRQKTNDQSSSTSTQNQSRLGQQEERGVVVGGDGGGRRRSRVWVASFGIGKAKHRTKLVFGTADQKDDFHRQFLELKRLILKRSEQQLHNFKQQQQQQERVSQSNILTTSATTNVPTNANNSFNISTISSIRSSITSVLPTPFSSLLLVGGTSSTTFQTQSQRNRTHIVRSINSGHDKDEPTKRENVSRTLASSVIASGPSEETPIRPQNVSGAIKGSSVASSIVNCGDVKLLVEIVSASDLPVADQSSTDPYVAVYLGQRLIHTTSPIKNDLNPVWTVETRSLFLISCTAETFFRHDAGLTFHILDQDNVTKDDFVASVSISQAKLLEMDGARESFKLDVPTRIKIKKKNVARYYKPQLHLRVRRAGENDFDFMHRLTTSDQSEGVNAHQSFMAPTKERVGVLRRESKYVGGVKLHRVKPRPDPKRAEQETKWMSIDMIEKETMKPSHTWVEAGAGLLGRMFVEVLKCDNLPNMDLRIPGRPQKGLTDAFCCLVFEDSIVTTDVIRDDLNPRWVPWSQRAFVFNVSHPSSQLHIGVFDYDLGLRGIRSHDPIGRISVDVTNFRPGTEYVLSYNLFESILNNYREPNGTITIRLVFEYDSFRQYALGGVKQLPQINHINVARKNDFKVAHFVCNGEEDLNQFNLKDLIAYQTELQSLVVVLYYIRKAVLTVIFWRGHKTIRLFGRKKGLLVPLHSMVAFLLGVTLIENLNLLPSYSLFCVAWFLMATNDYRQTNPSPWHGSMTVMQMWYALISDLALPETISDYENEAAIKRYEKELKRRQEDEEFHAKTRREVAQQIAEMMYSVSTTPLAPDDTSIEEHGSRLRTAPTINPVNRILVQVQQVLRRICRTIRAIKSIILWDESYIAFFIVNASICFGILIAWVPWSFILRWLGRVFAWVLLGPWMKLVDIYILPKMVYGGDEDDKDEALRKFAVSKIEEVSKAREKFLKKKEEALKHRAMKRYMFGRYVTAVPRFKEYRYRDVPLPQSYATPTHYEDGDGGTHGHRTVLVSKRTHGQTLVGEMVPMWGDAIN